MGNRVCKRVGNRVGSFIGTLDRPSTGLSTGPSIGPASAPGVKRKVSDHPGTLHAAVRDEARGARGVGRRRRDEIPNAPRLRFQRVTDDDKTDRPEVRYEYSLDNHTGYDGINNTTREMSRAQRRTSFVDSA